MGSSRQAGKAGRRETTIGAVMSFSNGKTSPQRSDDAPHPVYGSNGIIGKSNEVNSPPNTIVIGRVGSYCGSLQFSDVDCWVTDNAIKGSATEGNDARFLFYLLNTLKLNEWRIGSGQPLLNQTILSSIPATIPPLPEQRRIAGILGALDDKIALNRRMNATLEGMAQTLFRSWFVDYEPVRAKMSGRWRRGESLAGMPADLWDAFPARLAPTALGEAPAGWDVRAIREVVGYLRQNESPFKEPETIFTHFSIPAYDTAQMPRKELGAEIKSAKSRVPANSVLISRINPDIERVWLVDALSEERAVCSTEFIVLEAKSHLGRCYIYCMGKSASFRQRLSSLVTGTSKSHQRVPPSDALSIEIVVPPKPIADAFESIASEFLTRVLANRRESQTLAALRDALLPRLVSGELRV